MKQTTNLGRVVEKAKVVEDVTVEVAVRVEGDTDHRIEKRDIKEYNVVRPDVAKALGLMTPFIAEERVVEVLLLTGKRNRLNIGGWYIVKPGVRIE